MILLPTFITNRKYCFKYFHFILSPRNSFSWILRAGYATSNIFKSVSKNRLSKNNNYRG